MEITENTRYICMNIKTDKDWRYIIEKIINVGWNPNDKSFINHFKEHTYDTILYIGITDEITGRLYCTSIKEHTDMRDVYHKMCLFIDMDEFNEMIANNTFLILLV